MKAKVYFSRTITPEMVVALCEKTGKKLPGKVAVKLHTGEVGNQNFIKPVFWKPAVEMVHGTVVECNTAYGGERDTTEQHIRTLEKHGWTKMFTVDLLDAEGPDMELSIPNGKRIKKNFVGKDLANYDSMLVLAHFKGHPRGGYGGALKQLSIGIASSAGKAKHGIIGLMQGKCIQIGVNIPWILLLQPQVHLISPAEAQTVQLPHVCRLVCMADVLIPVPVNPALPVIGKQLLYQHLMAHPLKLRIRIRAQIHHGIGPPAHK